MIRSGNAAYVTWRRPAEWLLPPKNVSATRRGKSGFRADSHWLRPGSAGRISCTPASPSPAVQSPLLAILGCAGAGVPSLTGALERLPACPSPPPRTCQILCMMLRKFNFPTVALHSMMKQVWGQAAPETHPSPSLALASLLLPASGPLPTPLPSA